MADILWIAKIKRAGFSTVVQDYDTRFENSPLAKALIDISVLLVVLCEISVRNK